MGFHEKQYLMDLLFVTNNPNKLTEIEALMPSGINLLTLSDINFTKDIPETENTIEGNSMLKALAVNEIYSGMCFAEDTGLEIEALNGEPGVRSARYAGEGKCNQDNINLVLSNMKDVSERDARFKTVLTFFDGKENIQFEGICDGKIIDVQRGSLGFGYDSIFVPNGSNMTFAEMTLDQKNLFSHRKKALFSFIAYFREKYQS